VGKRSDGYHNLVTQYQRLSLNDVVSLYPTSSGILYTGPRLTEKPEDNLVVRAAEKFLGRFGGLGVAITLTKRIPIGAGLGGGSSDAAAVLRGLALMHGIDVDNPFFFEIAAEIGSDTPFFLLNVPSAVGESKGERLNVAEGIDSRMWVTVLYPGFEISTARAYKEFDNTLTQPVENDTFKVHSLVTSEESGLRFNYHNDFERIAFEAHPELRGTCEELLKVGAISAGLAGSGSSLFAIFDDETKARSAAAQRPQPWLGFVCRPC